MQNDDVVTEQNLEIAVELIASLRKTMHLALRLGDNEYTRERPDKELRRSADTLIRDVGDLLCVMRQAGLYPKGCEALAYNAAQDATDVLSEACEFLANDTPIRPGSEVANDLMALYRRMQIAAR